MLTCSICLEKLYIDTNKKNSNNIIRLKCGHKFHKKCIMEWFYEAKLNSDLCPICRECINFSNYSLNCSRYAIRNNKLKKKILIKVKNRIKKYKQNNENNYTQLDEDQINSIKSQYYSINSNDELEFLYNIMHEYNIYNLYLYQVRNIILYGLSYVNMPPLIDDSEDSYDINDSIEYFKINIDDIYPEEEDEDEDALTEENMLIDDINMCIGCELKKETQKLNIKKYNILSFSKKQMITEKKNNKNYKKKNYKKKNYIKKNYNIKK